MNIETANQLVVDYDNAKILHDEMVAMLMQISADVYVISTPYKGELAAIFDHVPSNEELRAVLGDDYHEEWSWNKWEVN